MKHLKPVNSRQALEGRTVVLVKVGHELSRSPQPYSVYTLVMSDGSEVVISQLCGEICFSVAVE